ncbi:MAG: M1 family metallopeptidase, partial [Chloroflexi bacterium]|nr:M1 family metallopeptidase [Chloroflexota bacterium]
LLPEFRGAVDLDSLPHYTLNATLDLERVTISGEQTVRFVNPARVPLDTAVFRLLANASTIYAGGTLTVDQVTRDGQAATWELSPDRTVLTVALEPAAATGEWVEIGMTFETRIPTDYQGYGILHHSTAVTSLSGWYPVLSPFDGTWDVSPVPQVGDGNHLPTAIYDVALDAPATHMLVSTGETLRTTQDGARRVWRVASGPARGFTAVLSDRFQLYTESVDGVEVNYYALPSASTRSPREALQFATDSLAVFNERFGPYPYGELDLVETLVSVGGYEFAGMVAIEQSIRTQASVSQLRFMVSHEVAHQWWFALVGSDPVEEPWLDESLATYAVVLYLEEVYGAATANAMISLYWQEGGRPDGSSPGIDVSALDYSSWAAYRGPVYYRGALFLDALRDELGDETFYEFLRSYATAHRFGIASTADLAAAAEEAANRELDTLFALWFGTPEPGSPATGTQGSGLVQDAGAATDSEG